MKIALFSHVCNPFTNGVATSVEQLARQLRSRNHDVTIISNNYDKFGNDFNKDNIRVRSIPIFYQNLKTPILINPALLRVLSEEKFELVHSHSDFGLAVLARQYARSNNIPIIQSYHCNYLEYAKENFGRYSYQLCRIPVMLYTKALCYTADRVIAPSRETKKLLEEDFVIDKDVDFIPNGIDLDKFKGNPQRTQELREQYGISKEDFVLLSISRLSKEKRIDEIIKLLPKLSNCENLKFLIVGGGPDENHLKRLVKRLQLNNVIFTGEIPFANIQEYYRLGDLFITNSIAETQALTPIEALASSVPIICPDIPLYEDLVDTFKNGFLFSHEDSLIKMINVCYFHRNVLLQMKEQARSSVERFSINTSVDKIEKIYEEEKVKKYRK